MADHVQDTATATGNDYAEHERTYTLIMKLSRIATASILLIVISLAIGGVTGAWGICGIGVVLAIASGVVGAMSSEQGSVIPVAISTVVVLGLWLMFG